MIAALAGHGRFTFVDALRGIAALAVVLCHAVEGDHIPELLALMPRWLSTVVHHGNLGVPIFFVLSGFVIAHASYGQRVTGSYVGRFMLRRSIRLDPPYWFAIAVAIAFAFLSAFVLKKPLPDGSWPQVLAQVFYLQDLFGYPQINTVFWTLCIEVQFYFVYVMLLMMSGDAGTTDSNHFVTILVAATFVSLLWPFNVVHQDATPHGLFLPYWHGFLLGVLAYWSFRQRRLSVIFWVIACTVMVTSLQSHNGFSLACAVTAATLSVAAMTGSLYRGLNWRWLQSLGLISYSLYLLHNPITGASFRVGYMLTGHSPLWEALWWIASIAACIIFAAGAWWLIERPSMNLARKISLKKPAARSHATSMAPERR
jgi:peptidoglycan/LPS O-acetylase OafA/YrhL